MDVGLLPMPRRRLASLDQVKVIMKYIWLGRPAMFGSSDPKGPSVAAVAVAVAVTVR